MEVTDDILICVVNYNCKKTSAQALGINVIKNFFALILQANKLRVFVIGEPFMPNSNIAGIRRQQ